MTEPVKKIEFDVKLVPGGEGGRWTCFTVPFNVEKVFGSKARVSVKGTINGFAYRSSIFPMGDGSHMMMVNKAMQQGAVVRAGDTVKIIMEPDTAPRVVTVPAELKKALAKNKAAKGVFEKFSYSHQREIVGYIDEAKKPETRARRVEKTLQMLLEMKR